MHIHLMENRRAKGWAAFGGYWPQGSVREDAFRLTDEAGDPVRVQSEVAARWPDGSVKWSRHIAPAGELGAGGELTPGPGTQPGGLCVRETEDSWSVSGGSVSLKVPKTGKLIAADFLK